MSPTKRPARRVPRQDVEDDPAVQKARERLRQANAVEDDDDEDDDPPPRPKKKAAAKAASPLRGGYTAAQKTMESTSDFAQTLKLDVDAVFIKFLEDVPYVSFRRHWIERSSKDGKSLRAWTCLKSVDQDCPLCEIGDRPQAVAAYNVALIGDDGQVLLKSWDLGPRLFGVIKGYNNDPKIGPLTRGYFMVSKTGKKGTVQHNVSAVSKTSMEEDYDMEVPDQAALDALEKYTPEVVTIPKHKELVEIATELDDDYE